MTEPRATRPQTGAAVALIERVRRRARAVVIGTAWVRAGALALAVVMLLGGLDYVFRLPRAVRVLHLVAVCWGLFELWRRVLRPAVRFRPGLAEVSRRVGCAAGGDADRLASGVELTGRGSDGGAALTAALARVSAEDADRFVGALGGRRFVRLGGLARSAGLLLAAAALAGASAAARPDLARIGIARTVWPFGSAEWPRRTAVADATGARVHPLGEPLQLRALLTKSSRSMGKSDVAAVYRVVLDGKTAREERVMLTSQHRLDHAGDRTGELFERLIVPALELDEGSEAAVEYWFEAEDSKTERRRIILAARPRVASITASVRPPAYARDLRGSFLQADAVPVAPDGAGVASLHQVLAGSAVRLELALRTPARRAGGEGEGWTQPDDRTLVYEITPQERARVEVSLVDASGLESAAPVVVAVEVIADAPAGVTIVDPAYDESVLATAVVDVAAEGRDDFGMLWLALERQLARPPGGTEGGAPEAAGGPVVVRRVGVEGGGSATELRANATIDLATTGARAGDEVWLTAVGRDVFAGTEGGGEADARVARSALRRLRIIDESAFIGQVRGELAGVRRAAIEIDREQALLAERGEVGPGERADRQHAVTGRLDAQRGAIDGLRERAARNALGDETLTGMLADAAGLLREATVASSSAAEEMDPGRTPDESSVRAEIDRVRDGLAMLVSMLDQGQDNWVARRTIESLLDDQRALAADTEALGNRTMGQSPEQLSPEDMTELERIAARQRDAAARAQQALDSLTDRAEAMERVDSAQSQAMSRAARRGRQDRVDEHMRQAAAQVRENQTRAAAQGQQAAMDALGQMLDDIDSAAGTRDQALRRVLAGVRDSLEGLIAEQERQIDALAQARVEEALAMLADPMVALAGNTLGLLDEIRGQRDLATIASLMERASVAQERAVGSLREASADSAAEAEDESLSLLRQARDEAERMDAQAGDREHARKRGELRKAYRSLLEQQVAVAADTGPWVGAEVDRRARATIRGLGQRQEGISRSLAELSRTTGELADATVFELAHRRLDRASASAAGALLAGEATAAAARQQAMVVRVLQSLVESMAEQAPGQPYGDQGGNGEGGGGGGGQDQPLIPELAELKLLRAMQAEVMEWTRNIDEDAGRPGEGEVAEVAELQQELAARAGVLIEKLTRQPEPPEEEPR